MANSHLTSAKRAKNDEFYTQYGDIQKEIEAYLEYNSDDIDGDGVFNLKDIAQQLKANKHNEWTPLEGDGDFRSDECVGLLKQSDIVVTNPPFSLFREYVKQLFDYHKKFVIIGNRATSRL